MSWRDWTLKHTFKDAGTLKLKKLQKAHQHSSLQKNQKILKYRIHQYFQSIQRGHPYITYRKKDEGSDILYFSMEFLGFWATKRQGKGSKIL